MKIEQISRTVHAVKLDKQPQRMLFISDVHYDSVKCDRVMLRRHLDEAKRTNTPVFIFGDWFDLMGGKYDPRSSYSDIRPEYKSITYLDDVIEDSAEFLIKYKDIIKFFCRGNHETNIEKRMHTSPLDRVAYIVNKNGGNITVAGYSGWLWMQIFQKGKRRSSTFVHYHHGMGGNAPRSKGVLRVDIDQMQFKDASLIVRGHTHQKWHLPVTSDRISRFGKLYQDSVHHLQLGSYKMLGDRFAGWATEKGFNTPRLGGWFVTLHNSNSDLPYWKVEEAQ